MANRMAKTPGRGGLSRRLGSNVGHACQSLRERVRIPSSEPGRRLIGGRLAALGTAGVVAGHTLAYIVLEPDGHHRASLLHETGHAYWHAALVVGLVAAAASITGHAFAQFRAVRRRGSAAESITRAGVRLGAFQLIMYGLMEAVERSVAHEPVTSMFSHHLFVIGVVFQIVVAILFVQVLRFVGRAAVAIAKKLAPAQPARRSRVAARYPALAPLVCSLSAWSRPGPSRAPPAAA